MCMPTQPGRDKWSSSERLAIAMAEHFLHYHFGDGIVVPSTIRFVEKDRSVPQLEGESRNQIQRLMIFTCRFIREDVIRDLQAWAVLCSTKKDHMMFWCPVRISFNILGHSRNDFGQGHELQGDFPVEKEIADLVPTRQALAAGAQAFVPPFRAH